MPFASTTRDKIMGILCLPVVVPAWVERVDDALKRASDYGGEGAVTRIEGYVAKYEAAQTALDEASDDEGLVQADVLRWAEGARTKGYTNQMKRYGQLLLDALFTPQEKHAIALLSRVSGSNTVRIMR